MLFAAPFRPPTRCAPPCVRPPVPTRPRSWKGCWRQPPCRPTPRPGGGPGAAARAGGARRPQRQGRAGRLPARVRAVEPGGHRADVPGRGPAAHPRLRDGGPADPRQDRRCGLAAPPGRQRIRLRQRIDLGPDADRPAGAAGRGAGPWRRAEAAGQPGRRAGDPRGGDCGHAHPRPAVRHGPHDRRGADARTAGRAGGIPPLLRHVGGGGADGGRCRPLLPLLPGRHRRHRRRGQGRGPIESPASRSSCRLCTRGSSLRKGPESTPS